MIINFVKYVLFLACFSLCCCASFTNEGAVDIRKTDKSCETRKNLIIFNMSKEVINKIKQNALFELKQNEINLMEKKWYSKEEYIRELEKISGSDKKLGVQDKKILISYLDKKDEFQKVKKVQHLLNKNSNLSSDGIEKSTFEIGDLLSLHLKSAYIHDFPENTISPYITKWFTRKFGKTTGEIAIIANAFEEINGKEIDFMNKLEGRVVFYSDDVLKKQYLNFNNMPIYGPISYKGAPFAFRISIFELDENSEQGKKMIELLAGIGAQAYPPASPVLNILNGLGNTFYNNDQTDVEFRYTMVLDPMGGSDKISHFTLEAGNYVLIRSEKRDAKVEWDDIYLDDNEGRLYKTDEFGELEPFTDGSYLVVEINKNSSYLGVELAQNNFSSLLTTLKGEDINKAENLNSTRDAILDVTLKKSQIINFHHAKELLLTLNNSANKLPIRERSADELITMILNSLDDKGNVIIPDYADKRTHNKALSNDQINYIVNKIKDLALFKKTGNDNLENYRKYFSTSNFAKIKEIFKNKTTVDYTKLIKVLAE